MRDARTGRRPHEGVGIDIAENAGLDTAGQQRPKCTPRYVEHMASIEGGQVGKASGLREDQARRGVDVRVAHGGEQHAQQAAKGGLRVLRRAECDELFRSPGQLAG
ncbi:hypothetical protein MACH15_04900 [Maricaulis maris]|nr:hypothetical protein MACH15_04900 [Maricaulis maris]